ncbi:hypothetical protein MKZ38_010274 [Zalerion maritima]|uniref:PHD-type domain-containing protein n=1 Tax=Zalerion maritima TaxID=339359 RepID=A0AAD5RFH9_9PEZI|nr:hypothetical protein MKZ38_010274 [Zalerion maritima]
MYHHVLRSSPELGHLNERRETGPGDLLSTADAETGFCDSGLRNYDWLRFSGSGRSFFPLQLQCRTDNCTSFVVPNGQPPTPTSSTAFKSPVFETPKNHRGPFESSGGWTPRFAEESSVFSATPGNWRGNSGTFPDFEAATPSFSRPLSAAGERRQKGPQQGQKRRRDTSEFALEVASHVNHFSPNPNLPLPPVDPSRQLGSSPGLPSLPPNEAHCDPERPSKRPCIQIATPPLTDKRSRARRATPRIRTGVKMQNDESFNQADFTQPGMTNFDLFGYPMSAPAGAASFDSGRSYWDADTIGMGAMDMDFNVSADFFQATSPTHRQMGSFDWGQQHTADMFQQPSGTSAPPAPLSMVASGVSQSPIDGINTNQSQQRRIGGSQDNGTAKAGSNPATTAPAARTIRPLAPKPATMTSPDMATFPISTTSFTSRTQNEDPFGAPLLTRPHSSIDVAHFNAVSQPGSLEVPSSHQLAPPGGGLRRSVSTREMGTTKPRGREPLSSPVKPALQQSSSENKGKKPRHRASLPTLAPAIKSVTSSIPVPRSKPSMQQNRPKQNPNRPSGRISPSKHHHRRLPSGLSAIPESSPRGSRTDVKFVIDSRGRARVEPVIVNGEHVDYPRHNQQTRLGPDWDSSGDDLSDTDDEPIIIPSRTTSFALPDPIEVQPSASFHASQRSISERSTRSLASSSSDRRNSRQDGDSDTETVLNDPHPKVSGDATSELRKMMETRQKRPAQTARGNSRKPRPLSSSFGGSLMSPTSLTDSSTTPTPSAERHTAVRCVCGDATERDNEYMVQCESCEMWLHGKCLKINRHNHPRVYICAFCANTPNMRNGRLRVGPGQMGPPAPIPSPLAHKSFKSFR